MKIAMMVRSYIPIPRPEDMIYAPIDLAQAIAKGLGGLGHDITLFAPSGSRVEGENVHLETKKLRTLAHNQKEFTTLLDDTQKLINGRSALWDYYLATDMFERAKAGEFDLLVFHHPDPILSLAKIYSEVPVVFVLHDPIDEWHKEVYEMFASPNQHFISISNNQRRTAPDLAYIDTVYNATGTDFFEFSPKHEDYLMFSGRIHPTKGVKEAIKVARDSNHRLFIIGPPDHGQKDYFEHYIKPELDENILYLGRVDQDQLRTYYQKAKALLTPVQWEEPFGLTTIEAMSCGTPVISLDRGAAPEIIQHGKTGYIAKSLSEMVEYVNKIDTIDRAACRALVEEKFSYGVMVRGYEKALQSVCVPSSLKSKYDQAYEKARTATLRKLKTVKRLIDS